MTATKLTFRQRLPWLILPMASCLAIGQWPTTAWWLLGSGAISALVVIASPLRAVMMFIASLCLGAFWLKVTRNMPPVQVLTALGTGFSLSALGAIAFRQENRPFDAIGTMQLSVILLCLLTSSLGALGPTFWEGIAFDISRDTGIVDITWQLFLSGTTMLMTEYWPLAYLLHGILGLGIGFLWVKPTLGESPIGFTQKQTVFWIVCGAGFWSDIALLQSIAMVAVTGLFLQGFYWIVKVAPRYITFEVGLVLALLGIIFWQWALLLCLVAGGVFPWARHYKAFAL